MGERKKLGRVIAIRTPAFLKSFRQPPNSSSSNRLPTASDVLGASLQVARGISAAGSASPLPWIGVAAEVVVQVLQVVQQADSNRRDFKSLTESVIKFINLIQDVTMRDDMDHLLAVGEFRQSCTEFTDTLTTILNDISALQRDNGSIKSYLKSASLANQIKGLQESLDGVQKALLVSNALRIRLQTLKTGETVETLRTDFDTVNQHLASLREGHTVRYEQGVRVIGGGDIQLKHILNSVFRHAVVATKKQKKLTKKERKWKRFYSAELAETFRFTEELEYTDWVATLIHSDGREQNTVVRVYEGDDAPNRYVSDLNMLRRFRHANLLQIFGTSDIGYSALIFHNDEYSYTLGTYRKSLPPSCFLERFRVDVLVFTQYFDVLTDTLDTFARRHSLLIILGDHDLFDPVTGNVLVTNLTPVNDSWSIVLSGTRHDYDDPIYNPAFTKMFITHLFPKDSSPRPSLRKHFEEALHFSSGDIPAFMHRDSLLRSVFGLCLAMTFAVENFIHSRPLLGYLSRGYLGLTTESHHGAVLHTSSVDRTILGRLALPSIFEKEKWQGPQNCGRVTIDGKTWSRFLVQDPKEFSASYKFAFDSIGLGPEAWFSQAHWVFFSSSVEYDPIDIELIWLSRIGVYFGEASKKPYSGLANTFMDSNRSPMPEAPYVFVEDMEVITPGKLSAPKIFWSSDKAGNSRWSDEQLREYLENFELTLEDIVITYVHESWRWEEHIYETVRHALAVCGYDPTTQDAARALGYPLLELDPSVRRFESVEKGSESESASCQSVSVSIGSRSPTAEGLDHVADKEVTKEGEEPHSFPLTGHITDDAVPDVTKLGLKAVDWSKMILIVLIILSHLLAVAVGRYFTRSGT